MKFIFPQNYKFNTKILGIIDYQTAILNLIWDGLIFLILNIIFRSINIKIFLFITCIVVGAIVYIIIKMPCKKHYLPAYISMILLAAGGIGNFIDRLVLGYVRDFLYFKLINFPVFNVADSYVTVGIIMLIILILFVYDEKDFEFLPFIKEKDNEQ